MRDWKLFVRPVIAEILRQQHYDNNNSNYNNASCFISSYQVAVLADRQDSTLRGNLPIGGEGVGGCSFAQKIAWHLSDEINRHTAFGNQLEIQFYSRTGLEAFTFNDGRIPSTNEFSIFRIVGPDIQQTA
jgi:hypothetical protein